MGLNIEFDFSRYDELVPKTETFLGEQVHGVVEHGLEAGVNHAKLYHRHQRKTGRLTDSDNLFWQILTSDETSTFGEIVNQTPYALYIEEGTRRHPIVPRAAYRFTGPLLAGQTRRQRGTGGPRAFLRFVIGDRTIFAKRVNHPGNEPMPFVGPGAEYAGAQIVHQLENVSFELAGALWD